MVHINLVAVYDVKLQTILLKAYESIHMHAPYVCVTVYLNKSKLSTNYFKIYLKIHIETRCK